MLESFSCADSSVHEAFRKLLAMSRWKTGLRMLSNNIYACLSARNNHWKFYQVKIVDVS